jgi:hypothetical protein
MATAVLLALLLLRVGVVNSEDWCWWFCCC